MHKNSEIESIFQIHFIQYFRIHFKTTSSILHNVISLCLLKVNKQMCLINNFSNL